jgi:membrane-associated phospholipid phosphatase
MKCPFYMPAVLFIITAIVLIVLSIVYVDTPVIWFMYEQGMRKYRLLHFMQKIPKCLAVLLAFIGLWEANRWSKNTISSVDHCLILTTISYVTALGVNYFLKFLFGRSLPATLLDENMSLISHGVYGFHFFHWGTDYQSFPSGHIAVTCVVTTVLWEYYPRLRWFGSLICTLVVISLIGAYHHFVSDVIAGALVGVGVGRMVLSLGKKLFNTNTWGKAFIME